VSGGDTDSSDLRCDQHSQALEEAAAVAAASGRCTSHMAAHAQPAVSRPTSARSRHGAERVRFAGGDDLRASILTSAVATGWWRDNEQRASSATSLQPHTARTRWRAPRRTYGELDGGYGDQPGQLATILNTAATSTDLRSASQISASHGAATGIGSSCASCRNADSIFSRIPTAAARWPARGRLDVYRETTLTMIQLRQLLSDIQANPRKYFTSASSRNRDASPQESQIQLARSGNGGGVVFRRDRRQVRFS